MKIIEYLAEKARKDAEEAICELQRLLTQSPECRGLLTKLLTAPDTVLEDAFGKYAISKHNLPEGYDTIPIGYNIEIHDTIAYLNWCGFFIGHEILDDGDPGIGRTIAYPGAGRISTDLENAEIESLGRKLTVYAEPFVSSCFELTPAARPASFDSVLDVIAFHEERLEKAEEWERRRPSGRGLLRSDNPEETQRKILALELGLTPS